MSYSQQCLTFRMLIAGLNYTSQVCAHFCMQEIVLATRNKMCLQSDNKTVAFRRFLSHCDRPPDFFFNITLVFTTEDMQCSWEVSCFIQQKRKAGKSSTDRPALNRKGCTVTRKIYNSYRREELSLPENFFFLCTPMLPSVDRIGWGEVKH